MPITYPLSLPAYPGTRLVTFGANENVSIGASVYTRSQQAQEWPGAAWDVEISYPVMDRAEAEPVIAFLLALHGPAGTFLAGDPRGLAPRGAGLAMAPLVDGAHSARGFTLATRGWNASTAGVLLAGDYLQVGQRMHKVVVDVDSDADGKATLDIWPALREDLLDGAAILLENTVCLLRLTENRRSWDVDAALLTGGITFKAVEAL